MREPPATDNETSLPPTITTRPHVNVCPSLGDRPSRTRLLDDIDGFAKLAGTTGAGSEGELFIVTSTADAGPGTLREGLQQGSRWVVFDQSLFPAGEEKVIALRSHIQIASDTTLDGRCANVRVGPSRSADGALFIGDFGRSGSRNVIITNLKIGPVPGRGGEQSGDGIRIVWGSDQFFISHVEIDSANDEAIEITRGDQGAMRGTVSYSRIFTTRKAVLIGDQTDNNEKGGEWATDRHQIEVSLHHNWFEGNQVRNPLVTDATAHLYNNYIDQYGLIGNNDASAGQEFGGDAWIWSEYNVLEPPDNGDPCGIHVIDYGSLGVEGQTHISARSNVFRKNARFCGLRSPDPAVPIPVPYEYSVTDPGTDGETLVASVTSEDEARADRAGWVRTT
jgi:pectate lyase